MPIKEKTLTTQALATTTFETTTSTTKVDSMLDICFSPLNDAKKTLIVIKTNRIIISTWYFSRLFLYQIRWKVLQKPQMVR